MERLSPKARALLDAAQRSEAPSAEFRARFERNWQRRAAQVGVGMAGAVAASLVAKSASGTGVASGAAAVGVGSAAAGGGAALTQGLATVVLSSVVGKVVASLGIVAVAGSVSYALWVPAEVVVPDPASAKVTPPAEPGPQQTRAQRSVIAPTLPATARSAEPTGVASGVASFPRASGSRHESGSPGASPFQGVSGARGTLASPDVDATPRVAPSVVRRSTLLERTRELQRAHELLRSGTPEAALALLEPEAPGDADALSVEREALRISAMCRVSDPSKQELGRALAAEFEQAHPSSPMLERLRHECNR